MKKNIFVTAVILSIIGFWIFPKISFTFAQSRIDELQNQIAEKSKEIGDFEKEIAEYEAEIDKILLQEKTLKNQISQLQTTSSKLKVEINLTEKEINNADLTIEMLLWEIESKNKAIENKKLILAEIIRRLNEEETRSLLEILLAHDSLSEFFSNIEGMEYFQKDINVNLAGLRALKYELQKQQEEKEGEKEHLENLQNKLGDQKLIADSNKRQKDSLLVQTKNKESNYKSLLQEVVAQKEAFEREIAQLEAQLRIEIDPNSLPPVGSGVLAWPLDDSSPKSCWDPGVTAKACITQFFGNTPFATANPQVYNGKGHGGVDFRASVGTPIKSAGNGIVTGIGNTDIIPGCYSFGKWVLIKHETGLSTLYAHLSLIKVSAGQTVKTGQVIGYSGQTGYATGPHLHFGVYASQGVQITKFEHSINCKNAIVPIAPIEAYLNPMSYL